MVSFAEAIPATGTAIIIATRGRPDIVNALVTRLAGQSKSADHIFVVASSADDVSGLNRKQNGLTVHIGRVGLTLQRNDGLALAGSRFSYIVFFDDDFVPSRFWLERMERLFDSELYVAGLTGKLLADGTTTAGIRFSEGAAIVGEHDAMSFLPLPMQRACNHGHNIGSNMAFRFSAIRDIKFDERLPLYAWLEDADFCGRVARDNLFVHTDLVWGVHLGHKAGRSRGIPLGYSQIANALYMAQKGTVPAGYLVKLVIMNILNNTVRSILPEPYVDRRGRLRGNLIALSDLLRGRIAPERVLEL
jgi:GT2 family glycosyltransferase